MSVLLGTVTLCPVSAFAQKAEAPRPVSDLVARLESNLTGMLNVAGMFAPARREAVTLLRYHEPAARSWQLDPALAKEMGDEELFQFFVIRASSALAGACELLSRYELRNLTAETIEKSKIHEKYWSETSKGHCHISEDGVFLTDSDGRPHMLRNRSDLSEYLKLQKKFKSNYYHTYLSSRRWDTRTFRSNLAYLKREFGQVEQFPECAQALRLSPGGKVYATQLLNLTLYVQFQEGQAPKVVFFSPLAW